MPELAQELVDDIVDHLREDTASLRNCAVLSTSWTYRSQAHLFRSIAVQGLTHAQQLGDILLRSPRIAMHVQELRVYGGDLFEVHDAIGCDLPSLHVVKVDEVAAEARQPRAAKLQHFASTHMLHMRCAHFKDVFQLGRALLTLPCLLMLRFAEGTTWTTTSLCQGPPISPFAWNLRNLDLRGLKVACATEFLKLLAHESSHDTLLGLDALSISSSCVTEGILRKAAPQLRELCIEHHEDDSRMQCMMPGLPLLKTLRVNAFNYYDNQGTTNHVFRVLFEQIRSAAPDLSALHIQAGTVEFHCAPPTSTVDWRRLLCFLADSAVRPPRLGQITIVVKTSVARGGEADMLRRSEVEARRIMREDIRGGLPDELKVELIVCNEHAEEFRLLLFGNPKVYEES